MENSVDKFVRGTAAFVLAALEAAILGVISVLRLHSVKRAVRQHVRFVARPETEISGQSALMIACVMIAHFQRSWIHSPKLDQLIRELTSSDTTAKALIAAVVTYLTIELGLRLLLRRPRWTAASSAWSRTKAGRRTEILRYLIAAHIFAGVVAMSLALVWMYGMTNMYGMAMVLGLGLPALFLLVTGAFCGQLGRSASVLSQHPAQVQATPRDRIGQIVRTVAWPALLVTLLMAATWVQALLVAGLFPQAGPQ